MGTQELTTQRLSADQIEAIHGHDHYAVPSTEQLLLYHGPDVFTSVVTFSPVAHLVVSIDGRMLRVNDVFREIVGMGDETIAGFAFTSIIASSSRVLSEEMLDRLRSKRETTVEWKASFLHTRGDSIPMSLNGVVVSVRGTPRYITILARNVPNTVEPPPPVPADQDAFQTIVEQIPAVTYIAEAESRLGFAYVSPQVKAILGYSQSECLARESIWYDLLHPDDREVVLMEIERGRDEFGGFNLEHRMVTRDGDSLWVRNEAALVPREAGARPCWHGVITDISRAKALEQELRENEERFRSLVMNSAGAVLVVERTGRIRYAGPSLASWLGEPSKEVEAGDDFLALIHPEDGVRLRQFLAETASVMGISPEVQVRLRSLGGWRHIAVAATNLLEDAAVQGILLNARDVTEQKDLENLLSHQAFHDPLTDLANRALFIDRLGHALDRAARLEQMVGVLYVDIDNFKVINDSLGHEKGDMLLVEIAARLQDAVRSVDTVARLGGDEFTVLIEDLTDLGAAIQCADRIAKSLAAPFNLPDGDVEVSASIGIAHSGSKRIGPEDLLRAADIGLYRAKNLGKARYAVFERGMTAPIHERLALEQDLRLAVERNEMEIYFQPVVDLTNGFVHGVEALVRWNHPERGLLMPEEFVAISESSGLIVDLGQQILDKSCRQVREWQQQDHVIPPLTLSVNLSTYQFRHPTIVHDITRALDESGLAPEHLILEITESLIMGNSGQIVDVLNDLKQLGVRLFIDDFGTGYSSLSFLKRFPFDGLKIDCSFVAGIERDIPNQRLVAAIIAAGQALDLDVVAEGIESIGQLSELRNLACTDGQGHLFASPAPASDITALVKSRVLLPQVRVLRDQTRRQSSQHE